jgi:hypothetical protein
MFGHLRTRHLVAYLLELLCLVFAVWYGIKYWNQDDGDESSQQTTDPLKPKTSKSTKPAKKHSHN